MDGGRSDPDPDRMKVSRRRFLGAAAAGAAGAALVSGGINPVGGISVVGWPSRPGSSVEPFYGFHQAGIAEARQLHTQFATFDVVTDERAELAALLQRWTAVAADLTAGRGAGTRNLPGGAPADSGEAVGLGAARMTVNFGFGPSLFGIGGQDRFGLSDRSPVPLVELPPFPGDQIPVSSFGGDLTVQVCADDSQVAFHAFRQLARSARPAAVVRWTQAGFNSPPSDGGTPRNLLGFKDGSVNPTAEERETFVWVGEEGPPWMTGGTYMVVRRIRLDLETWDALSLQDQEEVIGRQKVSGAPLGEGRESDPLDLSARAKDGSPVISLHAHVRLASPEANWGSMMSRRGYAYDNGVTGEGASTGLDAGELFVCYQRYPVVAFIPIYRKLSEADALSRFATHSASAIAAIPPAAAHPGDWVGRRLLED